MVIRDHTAGSLVVPQQWDRSALTDSGMNCRGRLRTCRGSERRRAGPRPAAAANDAGPARGQRSVSRLPSYLQCSEIYLSTCANATSPAALVLASDRLIAAVEPAAAITFSSAW